MSSSSLQKIVLVERVALYAATNLFEAAKISFVCKDWNETMQFYSLNLWKRLFSEFLANENGWTEEETLQKLPQHSFDEHDDELLQGDDAEDDRTKEEKKSLLLQQKNQGYYYNLLCDTIISNKLSVLVSPICNCGTGPNDGGLLGRSALLCAASVGSVPIMKELIERGASIETERNFFNENALHCAVRSGNLEAVKFIVEDQIEKKKNSSSSAALDFNERTKHSHSPLFLAISGRHSKIALYLLRQVEGIEVSNGGKSEPLSTIHAAARLDDVEIVDEILKKSNDDEMLFHTQVDGKTAIEVCVVANSKNCFEFLLEKMMNVKAEKRQEEIISTFKNVLVLIFEKFREIQFDIFIDKFTVHNTESLLKRILNDTQFEFGVVKTESENEKKRRMELKLNGIQQRI